MVVLRESRLTFRLRSPSHHTMFCSHDWSAARSEETTQRERERLCDIADFTHGEQFGHTLNVLP